MSTIKQEHQPIRIWVNSDLRGDPKKFWYVIQNGTQNQDPYSPGKMARSWSLIPDNALPNERRAGSKAEIAIISSTIGPKIYAYVTPIDNSFISRSYQGKVVNFAEEDYDRLYEFLIQYYDAERVAQAIDNERKIEYEYV